MEYLGEFLSPTNTIGLGEDRLTKYFYFRPNKYDDPDADLENIFIIKSMPEFPKRYDLLAENNLYAIDTIDVSKRISDEEPGVTNVSFVVTASYDLLSNIRGREKTQEEEEESDTTLDEDGNVVTKNTPPWKLKAKWGWQPVSVTVPFLKSYGSDLGYRDVKNTAGDRLLAETERYRIEISYSKSYSAIQEEFDTLLASYVNLEQFNPPGDILVNKTFPSGTLLILPPSYDKDYFEEEIVEDGVTTKRYTPYHTYNVKMIYDPWGWTKNLLNVGTRAKFNDNAFAEDIYRLVVYSSDTSVTPEIDTYTSLGEVLKEKQKAQSSGKIVVGERVTEPIPLTADGTIFEAAITNPSSNQYVEIKFQQFPRKSFQTLPFKL